MKTRNFPGEESADSSRTTHRKTQTEEHFIVYYNNASDYKNIQSINEYYTEISEIKVTFKYIAAENNTKHN